MPFRPPFARPLNIVFAGIAILFITGCATFSADGGLDTVSAMTKERTGHSVQWVKSDRDTASIDETIAQLLAQPLTPDAAVQIALLNNKGLQVALAELGVAESDLVQAGRIGNPGFTFGRLRGGGEIEIERGIMFNLVGLLAMPVRSGIERSRFEQAKLQAAAAAVKLAADTRRAYFNAVAAEQTAQYMEQVKESAEAGADLARQMAKVGNWSKLKYAQEQAFYADAAAQFARSRHNATATREQLNRLLGLWGAKTAFQLPDRLPDLPRTEKQVANIEWQAMRQRLDVQMAIREAQATASALGLTKATGFINVFHAGYANKSETGRPRANGYELELELPLFDWGGAKTVKAEALYMQSVHRSADIAIRARSEVRETYSAYRTSHDLAKHYLDEIVPLRKKISDELLLRYNGMLTGVFELLADAREQANSVNAAIEALRDFWIADADLKLAINGIGGAVTEMRGKAATSAQRAH